MSEAIFDSVKDPTRSEIPFLLNIIALDGAAEDTDNQDWEQEVDAGFLATHFNKTPRVTPYLVEGATLSFGVDFNASRNYQTNIGERFVYLQNNPEALEKSLQKSSLKDTLTLLYKSYQLSNPHTLSDDASSELQQREALKGNVKRAIIDNLKDQQDYVASLWLTFESRQDSFISNLQEYSTQFGLPAKLIATASENKRRIESDLVEDSESVNNEITTLDTMLIKHVALVQAYGNLVDTIDDFAAHFFNTDVHDYLRLVTRDSDPQEFSAADITQIELFADIDNSESEFQLFLYTANVELMSSKARASLSTLKQLQKCLAG